MNYWHWPLRALSPGGARGKLSVFIFHRVLPAADPLLPDEVTAEQFDWMMRLVSGAYNVLPLDNAVTLLEQEMLPPAAACVTFDDGYMDNATIALPILKRYSVPAAFFIATAFLDGGRMWNDDVIEAARSFPGPRVDLSDIGLGVHDLSSTSARVNCYRGLLRHLKYLPHPERMATAREIARRSGLPDRSDLMMRSADVRVLHDAGMEIGGHTHTHPILNSIDDASAEFEIGECKGRLEHLLGARVTTFAYPNGVPEKDFSERHKAIARKAGYRVAVTTQAGYSRSGHDPYAIPRFTPWDRTPLRFFGRAARNLWS